MATNDEIKEHLDHILEEVAKTQNIENFELIPNINANYGDGFVAQFFTGEILDKDTGNTISVAIKKAPKWEYEYNGLFVNEYVFYERAIPALYQLQKNSNVLHPFDNIPSYFTGSTAKPKKEYIAMDNLKPHDYVMFDKSKSFDQEHLEFIFKTYGKFHALSFVLRKKDFKKYENIIKDTVDLGPLLVTAAGKQMKAAVGAAVKGLDKEKDTLLFEELKDFAENVEATFAKSYKYNGEYKCFLHGDCWSNNMLFKYSETGKLMDIKLLDFQICRDGTPIHDLSYFFYSGASKKDFDNIEFYLQIYYDSFIEFAKELGADEDELFSFEVLLNEWKENAIIGVIFGIWLWQIKLTSKEEIVKLFADIEGMSEEEIAPIHAAFVEKTYEGSLYKENTRSILAHAFEYGVLNKNKIVMKSENVNE